jgi:hypothetical protein
MRTSTPEGALNQIEAIAIAKQKGIIYKVYSNGFSTIKNDRGKLIAARTTKYNMSINKIDTVGHKSDIVLGAWFRSEVQLGYLFDNYFHAYAYSLKRKGVTCD